MHKVSQGQSLCLKQDLQQKKTKVTVRWVIPLMLISSTELDFIPNQINGWVKLVTFFTLKREVCYTPENMSYGIQMNSNLKSSRKTIFKSKHN